MADWGRIGLGIASGGMSELSGLGPAKSLLGGSGWNPMEWGKQKADPRNAQLADGGFMRDYLKQRLGGLGQRTAPQVTGAQIMTGPQDQWRRQQIGLAQQLAAVASGQQAGAGELAVNRQRQQGLAAQLAMAASQRGSMAGMAGRAAARNMGTLSTSAAGMAQQAALQDQSSARGLLAGVLDSGRGADIGLATSQAGLNQQASLANQAAKLQQLGMDDAAIAQTLSQLYGISAEEMRARLAQEAANMQQTGYLPYLIQMGGQIGTAAAMGG